MKISFLEDGWHDYLYWQNQDKKTLIGLIISTYVLCFFCTLS
jgi:hypothetical protein